MSIKELLERIEKLQRRWTYHAVEHRGKRDNNNPNYNAYDHGVATGYLKALNTFKDWARRLDTLPEQPVTDCSDFEQGLEEELEKEIEMVCAEIEERNPEHRGLKPSGIAKIARHFAEWGAEHLEK